MNNNNILTAERKEEILEKVWDRKKRQGVLVQPNGIFVFLNDDGHRCPNAQVYFHDSRRSYDWSYDAENGACVLPNADNSGLFMLKYKKNTTVLKCVLDAEEYTYFCGFDGENNDVVLLAKVECDDTIYILYLDERHHIPFFSLSYEKCLYSDNAEALFKALRCLQSEKSVSGSEVNFNEHGTDWGI